MFLMCEQHRKQRKMLNPVFSLANMRELLPVIQPIATKLFSVLLEQLPTDGGSKEIDLLPWMARGTLEYICQAGMGYTFHALEPSKTNEYADAIRRLAPAALRILLLRPFVPMVMRNFSLYWRNKMVDWLPIKPLRDLRDIVAVMDRGSRRIFAEKRAAMHHGREATSEDDLGSRMKGKDIMSIMLRANASSDSADRLTDEELLGQMNTLILAGFETTTTAICRMLYILAREPAVQARLRREIRQAKRDYAVAQGITFTDESEEWKKVSLPYDILVGLPYLDAVLRETLRDTTLPLQFPVRSVSGAEVSAIAVPKNTTVIMSILAANHNKEAWGEDASVWRPERWLSASGERIGFGKDADTILGEDAELAHVVEGTPGNKGGVKYPGVYASIGFKFAEMEMKQILTTLLSSMHFSLPSAADENGVKKEIYWKMNGLQVPVVRPPHGDFMTAQVPLDVRLVREDDFLT
ncbi:hypothetical protein A0H81_12650 [Grifola frondosa]|uniref:Cytochrome P450 n=1 Tax=Grifola frondosa TaxID=5627 RepID=A0A1C7LS38_GRIFR|nr:hypothetical protein A0H81_12650 [Grifola frondosa]